MNVRTRKVPIFRRITAACAVMAMVLAACGGEAEEPVAADEPEESVEDVAAAPDEGPVGAPEESAGEEEPEDDASEAAGVCAENGSGDANSETLRDTTISVATLTSVIYSPFMVAIDKGYYADEGLDVELQVTQGSVATPALLSGDLDFSSSSASALGASLQGADLVVVHAMADRPPTDLWVTDTIQDWADFEGKTVGVQSRGDTHEIAMRLVLEENGVDPESVAYNALGFGAGRITQIVEGAVAGLPMNRADAGTVNGETGDAWTMMDPLDVRMLMAGLASTGTLLEEEPEFVRATLCATIKGVMHVIASEDDAVEVMLDEKWNPQGIDEEDVRLQYEEVIPGVEAANGVISVEAQEAERRIRSAIGEIESPPPVEQLFDLTIVQEVVESLEGWEPS